MPPHTRVLVFDAPTVANAALCHLLAAAGHQVACTPEPERALESLAQHGADVVIVGLAVAGVDGVARVAGTASGAQLLIATEKADSDEAHRALRLGAFGLVRPSDPADALLHAVETAAHVAQLSREVATLRARVGDRITTSLVGRSRAVDRVRELIGRAAASREVVLITGEAGTGKSLVAQLVHDLSDRCDRPFVTVRCADVDAATLHDELFGAPAAEGRVARIGLLEHARGGTIVLDGYPELPRTLRVRIAELMSRRTLGRDTVAGVEQVPVDVRFVLTARDVAGATPSCSRDDDLLRQFSVLPIALPPLRERRRDIPLLVEHFRARHPGAGAAPELADMSSLVGRDWRGNVRELEHFVELNAHRPPVVPVAPRPSGTAHDMLQEALSLDAVEQRYILLVLQAEDGNQSRAADRLGIDRRTLYRKLKQYRDGRAELRAAIGGRRVT